MSFKISDRVRAPYSGLAGEVTSVDPWAIGQGIGVRLDNGNNTFYSENQLELIKPKFKAGDRVRISDPSWHQSAAYMRPGVLTENYPFANGLSRYPFRIVGETFDIPVKEKEIELIPATQFKVGDKVRRIRDLIGAEGIVTRIYPNNSFPITVSWGYRHTSNLAESDLELIKEDPAPEFEKLQTGDKVRVTYEAVVEQTFCDGGVMVKTNCLPSTIFGPDNIELIEKAAPPRVPAPGEIWANEYGHEYVILADPNWCRSISSPNWIRLKTSVSAKKFVS